MNRVVNPIEIIQILIEFLIFKVFAHLHLININEEQMTPLVLMNKFRNNLKILI